MTTDEHLSVIVGLYLVDLKSDLRAKSSVVIFCSSLAAGRNQLFFFSGLQVEI